MRDYGLITRRLKRSADQWNLEVLATASGIPLYHAAIEDRGETPSILIIAGTHGDEPAGVETVLQFLEADRVAAISPFSFSVLPCFNPDGWVRDRRADSEGNDLNWSWDRPDLPAIRALRDLVDDKRYEAVIDLHEDWESSGFYLYEQAPPQLAMGDQVIMAVEPICPINRDAMIDGKQAQGGVIRPDTLARAKLNPEGIPIQLALRHTDHFITIETPTALDLNRRVRAQLTALRVILDFHQSRFDA